MSPAAAAQTMSYAPGRHADVYGDPAEPTVLLWHGTQTDARASVAPLAHAVARRRFSVVAPDWDSHAADGGRGDLLSSVDFARAWSADADRLTLVGWSLGAVAAAGLTIRAERFDLTPARTVCLAGAFGVRDPISGAPLRDLLEGTPAGTAFTLLHGLADDVVPVQASREFAAALSAAGWPVEVVELEADHATIAGARYDAQADRYGPAEDPHTLVVADDVAAHIVAATR